MNDFDIVLRVRSSETFDVDGVLRRHPAFAPEIVWRKGDVRRGHLADTTGLSLSVGTGGDWRIVWPRALQRLRELRSLLEDARASGGEATVDVGVFPGGETFTVTLWRIPPDELAELAALGVGLEVTAYPIHDQEDQEG